MGIAVGTPDLAGFVVAHIESLARRVADRIVGPRSELVFAAVAGPSVTAAFGRGRKPNLGFATTLIQGAGVAWPGPSIVTYSLPPAANPPNPLKNSSSGVRGAASRSGRAIGASLSGRMGSIGFTMRSS